MTLEELSAKLDSIEKGVAEKFDNLEKFVKVSARDVLDMDEACAYTGFSKSYLYTLVSNRAIPHYKSAGGKRTYFDRSELRHWMLNCQVKTAEEVEQEAARKALNTLVK